MALKNKRNWFPSASFLLYFISITVFSYAEAGDTLYDQVFQKNIRTVLLHKDGWELSYPVISLGAKEKLKLSFDELTKTSAEYHYIIKHCNASWLEDDLDAAEFMDSPEDNRISQFALSFSTYISYVHYELVYPTGDWAFHRSGNYCIIVYEQDPSKPIFTRRFMITEDRLNISVDLRPQGEGSVDENTQAMDIKLILPVNDDAQLSEVPELVVNQNGNWYNSKTFTEPMLSGGTEIEYRLEGKDAFPGNNEFRNFDIKSVKYQSPNIEHITYMDNCFQIGLHMEKSRANKPYYFDNDLNGKSLIKITEGVNSGTDADYVNVYFNLYTLQALPAGKLYVTGSFCYWNTNEENCMKYNSPKGAYELTLQLKQGYYNYLYAFIKKGKSNVDFTTVEGNHFETENDYLIMAYQKDSRGYDRLTGFRIFNTITRK